jgi:membrane protease YdiL (CAAX protease family)
MLEEKSTGYRFGVLLLLVIAGTLVGYIIGIGSIPLVFNIPFSSLNELLNINSGSNITPVILKYLQLVLVCFMFIIPSNIYSRLFSSHSTNYFDFNKTARYHYFFAFIILVTSIPLVTFLSGLNQQVTFPSVLASIEKSFRLAELSAETSTRLFLKVSDLVGLFTNLLVIALLAAFAEELIFRGIVQKLLMERIKNIHLAIWVGAFIFSAFHLQFFSMLPRICLGAALGYSYYWSRSIWVPMFLHFMNNAFIVLSAYFYEKNIIAYNPNNITVFSNSVLIIAFISSIVVVFFWIKQNNKSWNRVG